MLYGDNKSKNWRLNLGIHPRNLMSRLSDAVMFLEIRNSTFITYLSGRDFSAGDTIF